MSPGRGKFSRDAERRTLRSQPRVPAIEPAPAARRRAPDWAAYAKANPPRPAAAAGLLAKFLQPRRHVDGIAEKSQLPPRAAAFADDHGTGMQAGAKTWHHAEFPAVRIRFF